MFVFTTTFSLSLIHFTDIRFWRELKQQGVTYPGTMDKTASVTKYTVDNTRKFLAEIYNVTVEQIPMPEYAAMGLWDSFPYGAAWYSQKPGYDFEKVCLLCCT